MKANICPQPYGLPLGLCLGAARSATLYALHHALIDTNSMTQQGKNKLKTLIDTFMSDLAHHASQSGKAKKLRVVAVKLARDGGEAKLRGDDDTWLHEWAETFYEDAQKVDYDTDKCNQFIMADRLHDAIIDLLHEENKE